MLLDWLLCRDATPVRPTATWVALADGSGSEIGSGSGYERQTVRFGPAASPGGTASNVNGLAFGPLSYWATVQVLQIFDAATAGRMLWEGELVVARTAVPLDQVNFPAGALSCGLS